MNTKKIMCILTYYFPLHIMLTLASVSYSLFIIPMVALNLVILGIWILVCTDLLKRIENLESRMSVQGVVEK